MLQACPIRCAGIVRRKVSHLNSLELSVLLMPPPMPKITSLSVRPSGTSYESALLDFACECKNTPFVPLLFFCTHGTECSPTVVYDPRNIRKCFYVVDIRRFLPVTLCSRERRLESRHTSFTFQRCDQSCFFTAYECTGTSLDDADRNQIPMSKMFFPRKPFSLA